MYSNEPDLVVFLGIRAFLSLLAVFAVAVGNWRNEDRVEKEAAEEAARSASSVDQKLSGLLSKASEVLCEGPLGCAVADGRDDDGEAVWHLTCGDVGSVLPAGPAPPASSKSNHPEDEVDAPPSSPRQKDPVAASSSSSSGRSATAAQNPATAAAAKAEEPLTWNGILNAIQHRVVPPSLALNRSDEEAAAAPPAGTAMAATAPRSSANIGKPVGASPHEAGGVPPLVDCGSSSVAVEEQWAAMQRSHPWLAFDGKRLWPAVVLAGWLLLGLSTLLTRRSWWGLDVNFFAFVAMVSCIFLAIAQYAQHHGMVDRENQPQHGCLIVFGMVVLGIMLSLGCPPGAANVNWAPPLGACMAGAGWVASWYSRKAGGELYAKSGKLNPRPVVFHLGGILWAWGWFWTWVGMNAVPALPDSWYIPLFLGSRAAIAYTGAFLVASVLYSVCYALDEMNPEQNMRSGPGFGALGYFVGSVWEIKIAMTLSWLYMGSAEFLPTLENADNVLGPYMTFLAFCLHGAALSILYEIALRSNSLEIVRRWALNSGGVLVMIALLLCFRGTFAAVLAIASAVCIFGGQMRLHQDRKRGHHWVATGGTQLNPDPKAFSTGSPSFGLGMALLAWAVSLR